MINYWVVRGHLREGRGWLERALGWGESPNRGETPSAERAWALIGLGWLVRLQGDLDRAEEAATEALRVAIAAGARMTEARARHGLAAVHQDRGRYEAGGSRCWTRRWPTTGSWSRRWSPGPNTSPGLLAPGPGRPRRRRPGGAAATWRRRNGGNGHWATPGG